MIPYGNIPKSYKDKDTRVHYLTCKKTIYGLHRTGADFHSKTCIVCFTDPRHAMAFKYHLMHVQTTGRVLERCVQAPDVMYPYASVTTKGSFIQMSIETSPIVDMLKLCHMNFFDMYLVFDINHHDGLHRSLSYYEMNVTDTPARGYLNYHFNHLLEI